MNKKGMTLTEILIVVSIVAFLSLLGTVFFRTQIFKGYDARRKADIKRIGIAVEEYEKDHDCYPLPNLVTCTGEGSGLEPYLGKIPCDPITKVSYYYDYEDNVCPSWYRLYAVLDNDSDPSYQANIGPSGAFNYEYSSPNAPIISDGVYTPDPLIDFYGCSNGACVDVPWDPYRPGPVCDPNFQNSSCYDQCKNPVNECKQWDL